MKRNSHVMSKLSLIALASLASASALAENPLGWYAGGNIGRTRSHFDNPTNLAPFIGPGFVINSAAEDNRDTGYKLYGGYQFNQNLALEGGYFNLGNFGYTYGTVPAGTFGGDFRVRGFNLDLVGMFPITDRFSVLGRIGAANAQTRTHFTSTGLVPVNVSNPRERDTNLKLGVGLQYAFTDNLSVRAELERYRVSEAVRHRGNIDMASVGLVYYFGEKARAPVARAYVPPPAPVPVYVAPPPPAPPPPPVYVPPPPPPPVYTPPPAPRPAKEGRN